MRVLRSWPLAGLLLAALVCAPAASQEAPEAAPPPPAAPPPEPARDASPREAPVDATPGEEVEVLPMPIEPIAPAGMDPYGRETPIYADTLAAREAPADVLQRFRDDPTYLYDSPEAERPSGWDRFLSWLYSRLFRPLLEGASSDGGEIIAIVFAVFLLGWVITRLLRADSGPLFGKKDLSPGATSSPLLDVEDIREVDVSTLLDGALARGQYREAVRFRYVLALQRLAERGDIEWRRDKTNREYVREARAASGAVGEPFADVTRAFDYVWYGERPVDADRYGRLGDLFDRFDAALSPIAA